MWVNAYICEQTAKCMGMELHVGAFADDPNFITIIVIIYV